MPPATRCPMDPKPVPTITERSNRKGPRRRIAAGVAAVAFGGMLCALGLAAGREAAERLAGPVMAARQAPEQHLTPDAARDILRITEARTADAATQARRALALLALNRDRPAARALTAALRQAPADPAGWTRLALVRHRIGAAPERIAQALAMALRTGPRTHHLAPIRAELALYHWPRLAARDRRRARVQLRLAWTQTPAVLRTAARASGRHAVLAQALGHDPRRPPRRPPRRSDAVRTSR